MDAVAEMFARNDAMTTMSQLPVIYLKMNCRSHCYAMVCMYCRALLPLCFSSSLQSNLHLGRDGGMHAIPKKAKHHSTLGLALHPSKGVDALYFCRPTFFVDYKFQKGTEVL